MIVGIKFLESVLLIEPLDLLIQSIDHNRIRRQMVINLKGMLQCAYQGYFTKTLPMSLMMYRELRYQDDRYGVMRQPLCC